MHPVAGSQFQLAMPARAPTPDEIARVVRAPDRRSALARVAADSTIDHDRLAKAVRMSPGHFSRLISGRGDHPIHLPLDAYHPLQQAADSWALLLWDVHRAGFDPASLRPLESELQREVRLLREELDQERRDRIGVESTLRRVLTGQGR